MRYYLLLLVLAVSPLYLSAQETVQIVTKVIEKTFNYRVGYEVNVEGQKAEIFVDTWDKDEIGLRLEISAKHVERSVAEAELETVNFVAERIRNKVYLRNYRFGGKTVTESILSVTYHISLPEDCPVYVKNYFGAANISNLTNRLRIFGEYSQIDIDNVNGLMDIRTRFGDIVGEKLDGNVTINARRSDVTLLDMAGNYQINAQYGLLKLAPSRNLLSLDLNAEKSEVELYTDHPERLGYTLTATHGNIDTPDNLMLRQLENTPEIQKVQFRPRSEEVFPSVTVMVTFGDIRVVRGRPDGVRY